MRAGDHNRTNRMFRMRIYAQGFTLLAMVAGSMYWAKDREKRKEFEGAVAEQKAKEKNQAWIRELEARDREDKEIQATREARRLAANAVKAGKVEKQEGSPKAVEAVNKSQVPKEEKDKEGDSAEAVKATAESAAPTDEKPKKGTLQMVTDLISGKK